MTARRTRRFLGLPKNRSPCACVFASTYIGDHFAKMNGTYRKTYMLGAQRVAVRNGGTLTYLHSDHLGSASTATNITGTIVSEQRYYPYGEVRWSSGTLPTDYTYTAQREEASMGLMDYRARYYDPYINRFIQADTIVPNPVNPQALNRYTYGYGNPVKYRDPDGHMPRRGAYIYETGQFREYSQPRGLIQFIGNWGRDYKQAVNGGVRTAAKQLHASVQGDRASTEIKAGRLAESPTELSSLSQCWDMTEEQLFRQTYGTINFRRVDGGVDGWAYTQMAKDTIWYGPAMFAHADGLAYAPINATHELGHALAQRVGYQPYSELNATYIKAADGTIVAGGGGTGNYTRSNDGYVLTNRSTWPWQQNTTATANEDYADMFSNWAHQSFDNDTIGAGAARNNWMSVNMPGWIALAVSGN